MLSTFANSEHHFCDFWEQRLAFAEEVVEVIFLIIMQVLHEGECIECAQVRDDIVVAT